MSTLGCPASLLTAAAKSEARSPSYAFLVPVYPYGTVPRLGLGRNPEGSERLPGVDRLHARNPPRAQRRGRSLSRAQPTEAARAGNAQPWVPAPAGQPSAAGARRPPRLLQVSRGHAPGSASTRSRAPAAAAEHASYLLVEGDGLVLIVPVLAAVGGTGLHHPSGPPHFPSAREAGEGAVGAAALGFDTVAAFGGFG